MRRWMWAIGAMLSWGALTVPSGTAGEKDILAYTAQKEAPAEVKKIAYVADTRTHGKKGNHEFMPGAIFLARTLNAHYPNVHAVVHRHDRWPKDLAHVDAVVVLLNHGGPAVNPAVEAAMARGAGFAAIHYGIEVDKGPQGEAYLRWMGGYFEPFWSVNPWWTPKFETIPEHEITRGVKPFSVNDEWYYHMRFVDDMKGVTPILSAVAPLETIQGKDSETSLRGGNPTVRAAVTAGKPQHVAWAYVRPDGARGFGFSGYHRYENLQNDSFRTLLVNAVAWTAKLEIPKDGIPTKTPTIKDLDDWYKEGQRIAH